MSPTPGNFVEAAVLALSVGSVAFTLTSTKISQPLRLWVATNAAKKRTTGWRWLVDLLLCPYCVSHWLAFAAVLVYRPWLVDSGLPLLGPVFDFAVTSTVVVVGAMVPVYVIKKALLMDAQPKNPVPQR